MKDRPINKWRRKPTPPAGTDEGSRAVWLAFPTHYLGANKLPPGVTRIDAAPAGQATTVEMFFTRETEPTVVAAFGTNYKLVSYTSLPNGEFFVIRSGFESWVNRDRHVPGVLPGYNDLHFTASLPRGVTRHLSLELSSSPKDNDALLITELSGYAVPAGTPWPV